MTEEWLQIFQPGIPATKSWKNSHDILGSVVADVFDLGVGQGEGPREGAATAKK